MAEKILVVDDEISLQETLDWNSPEKWNRT